MKLSRHTAQFSINSRMASLSSVCFIVPPGCRLDLADTLP
jgi:hypothetical protein